MAGTDESDDWSSPFAVDDPEIVARIERLSSTEIDALPFGVIRLDQAGRVVVYSRTEARQSGFGDRNAVGRLFFTDLAPCMGSAEFLRRIEQARAAGTLDVSFEQVGDFDDAERELSVRIVSASDGGLWLLHRRLA